MTHKPSLRKCRCGHDADLHVIGGRCTAYRSFRHWTDNDPCSCEAYSDRPPLPPKPPRAREWA